MLRLHCLRPSAPRSSDCAPASNPSAGALPKVPDSAPQRSAYSADITSKPQTSRTRSPDCARAASGQAAAPPTSVMKSRRLTGCPSSRGCYSIMATAALCITANSDCRCPCWVISGHSNAPTRCPLHLRKRTFGSSIAMSALCQKQTFITEKAPHNRFSPLRFHSIMCSGTVACAGVGNTPDRAARVISDQ